MYLWVSAPFTPPTSGPPSTAKRKSKATVSIKKKPVNKSRKSTHFLVKLVGRPLVAIMVVARQGQAMGGAAVGSRRGRGTVTVPSRRVNRSRQPVYRRPSRRQSPTSRPWRDIGSATFRQPRRQCDDISMIYASRKIQTRWMPELVQIGKGFRKSRKSSRAWRRRLVERV